MREKIQRIYERLAKREQKLFRECVKLIEQKETMRALVYAEEISFIRKIKQRLKKLIQR